MDLAVILVLFLAAGLDQVKTENTGTCDEPILYSDVGAVGSKRERSKDPATECPMMCNDEPTCLSYSFNPMKKGCFLGTNPQRAYKHKSKPGLMNVELPCRIPDNGCPFEVFSNRDDTGSSFTINADALNPMMCHKWCTDNVALCGMWKWDTTAGMGMSCQYASSAGDPMTFTDTDGVFIFIPSCP